MHISEIRIHPLKSAAGILRPDVALDPVGPRGDRRWMAVDPSGTFLSQRATPRLARIGTRLDEGGLLLTAQGLAPLPVGRGDGAVRRVRVWGDALDALDCGDEAAEWLTAAAGEPCRLVRLPEDAPRAVDPDFGREGDAVGFADGFPLLLVSRASLDDLNGRLSAPLPMDRFRPNLVVEGAEPYAEDRWRRISVGGIPVDVVKPCARCAITTTDQDTGERGKEPLRTLATYRRRGGQVFFAQNAIHRGTGVVRVGDPVEVLETGPPPAFDPPVSDPERAAPPPPGS